jgi:serine/threonine protein kinase
MEAEPDTNHFNDILCSASKQFRKITVNMTTTKAARLDIGDAIAKFERETQIWGVKQRLLAICISSTMTSLFNDAASKFANYSSVQIAVVHPSALEVDQMKFGTKNIVAVLDVANYNQGYAAAHLALLMHRTNNMMKTPQVFGPYVYHLNSRIPARWRCALISNTYVMCPAFTVNPACPCVNFTRDLRIGTVLHTSPQRVQTSILESGFLAFLDGLSQPPQWEYFYPPLTGVTIAMIEYNVHAILEHRPDVLITSVLIPETAQSLRINGSLARHIVTFNGGWGPTWPTLGAELFVGQDEFAAGVLIGKDMRRLGKHRNVVCALELFNFTKYEQRCNGVRVGIMPDGFMTKLYTASSVRNQVSDFLSTSFASSVTGWVCTSAGSAVSTSDVFLERGLSIPLFAFDLTPTVIPKLESGVITMTINQQAHVQGFMAMMHGLLSGLTDQPVHTMFLDTGSVPLTKDNMSAYYCESSYYKVCRPLPLGPDGTLPPTNGPAEVGIFVGSSLSILFWGSVFGGLTFCAVVLVTIHYQRPFRKNPSRFRERIEMEYINTDPTSTTGITGSPSLDRYVSPMVSALHPKAQRRLKGWVQGQPLGRGSYGTVYRGLCSDGSFVAVKSIDLDTGTSEAALNSIVAEVNLMQTIPRHSHIVQYYSCEVDRLARKLHILMEYVPGGSVGSLARSMDKPFSESVVRQYTRQILLGLQHLHSLNIVHRDIKGDNLLLSEGHVKLADFGTAKRFEEMATMKGTLSVAGTPLWMAPEVLTGAANRRAEKKYDTKADVWSVGCTVVEMLNKGNPPWPKFSSLYEAVYMIGRSTGLPPGIPEGLSDSCMSFLSRCFERDVQKRADVDELLLHTFVNETESSCESPRMPVSFAMLNDVISPPKSPSEKSTSSERVLPPTTLAGKPPRGWSESLGCTIHDSI